MGKKQSHKQAKEYQEIGARSEKFIVQCITCQEKGYDIDLLKLRSEKTYREQISNYFAPMKINSLGQCEKCSA